MKTNPLTIPLQATTSDALQAASPFPLQIVHIDRVAIGGHIVHRPIGHLFYAMYDGEPVAAGASAFKPQRRTKAEDVYVRSRHIEGANEQATWLEFNCCPPQILQGHNV